jgi:hypothetical protein
MPRASPRRDGAERCTSRRVTGFFEQIRRYERGRRFWRNVEVAGRRDCWSWTGVTDQQGFGRYGQRRADQLVYEAMGGTALPEGTTLDHVCGDPGCVNPEHLHPASRTTGRGESG